MTKITQEEEDLLEKGIAEEKTYNWVNAAKIYEKIGKKLLDENKLEEAAKVYKKFGYVNSKASETADTSEEYLELNYSAIRAYEKAGNLFKHVKHKSEILECEAEVLYIKGLLAKSVIEAKKYITRSYDHFINSSEIYKSKDDKEGYTRVLSRGAFISCNLIYYCSDPNEIEENYQKCLLNADRSWKLSMEIGNIGSIAESLIAEGWASYIRPFIMEFTQEEGWEEYFEKYHEKCKKSLEYIESFTDLEVPVDIFIAAGGYYCYYGIFVKDKNIQRKYIDKGIELLERAINLANKTKDKSKIIYSLFWVTWFAILGGRFKYIQKRILKDVNKVIKLGKIYDDLYSHPRYTANLLPAIYYLNFAHRSFLSPTQRKIFAKKGIKYSNEALKATGFLPYFAWIYQILTSLYSQLVILATSKNTQEKYSKKMLQYMEMTQKIALQYEGGYTKAAGYSCTYRAHKTLADIAKTVKNKIEMLTITIDALEKYVLHEMESQGRIIAAKLRLGTLNQELAIISNDVNILLNTKELFHRIIQESLEEGYYHFSAAAYEYMAQIEDRLGNHSASAAQYEKAMEAHKMALNKIEYIPLKKKIEEKIAYSNAWKLIEKAKAFHKKEEHFQSKKQYEEACKILEPLKKYYYEAAYYSAWAFQEEAEQYSKNEKHIEAIQRYETTKNYFQKAKDLFDETFKQPLDKEIKERIRKLKRVADVRINYCSARLDVEKARILAKKGDHLTATEKFASAASKFKDVCSLFKIEKEKEELKAVYYLCKAWESMELAENYKVPERFKEAASLFSKASDLFIESKLKFLASGNSSFCLALEYGCKFDQSHEIVTKAELYTKVKSILRTAATSYEKGGFVSGADWALATSTYFDGIWHLIKADYELEITSKKNLLDIGSNYLKSAARLFGKSGYKEKENEVLESLSRVKKEEKILVSALNTIKKPAISGSIEGIIAPACPLETSQSPRISEIRQFAEQGTTIIKIKEFEKKFDIIYKDLIKEDPKFQRRECKVGIAQIGISETGDIISEFYEIKTSGLLGIKKNKVKSIRSTVKTMIDKAYEENVNILIFPEMIIDLNYVKWLEELSTLARSYDMYIIPGSYHEEKTMRNISTVIGPEGILWEQEKHIPAMINLGRKRVKEAIKKNPPPNKILICNTKFGRIAIAICRDFLDMDLRVELKNFEPPVDIIINPAFTPVTADFKAIHFDARRSIYAYCFFANVAEFGDSLIYTPEKDRTERSIPAKQEGLIYKDIDLFKLRSERKKWEKEQEKEVQFIQSTR